jgi:hypothetical protein
MEKIYLPRHLLMPFFNEKEFHYKTDSNPEKKGWLGLTVSGDGSVCLHLYSVASKFGLPRSDGQILTKDMIDKIFWSEERKAFVAIF